MSFRSKYHHVFMEESKPEFWWKGLKPHMGSWDSDHLAVNLNFLVVPWSGGGGSCAIFDVTKPLRVEKPFRIIGHTMALSDMKFSPHNEGLLATSSADGTVRAWNIPEEGLTANLEQKDSVQEFAGHTKKCGIIGWHPTCSNVLVTSSVDNTIKIWDVEKGTPNVDIEFKKVPLHFDWNKVGNTMVATSRDKKMYIIDPRTSEKFVKETDVFGSMKGIRCVWLKDKDLICATGFDRGASRTAKLFDINSFEKPSVRKEIDLQAGIIMPFYDEDLGILYFAGKGEGMIRYYDTEERGFHEINKYMSNVPQRGIAAIGKLGLNTMDHEVGRFFKLTQDAVVPVRVLFPRKSTMFQKDLFPETNGGEATGTAEDFFSGAELKPLEKISLEPGKRPEGKGVKQETTFAKKEAKAVKVELKLEYWKKEELIEHIHKLDAKIEELEKKLKQ